VKQILIDLSHPIRNGMPLFPGTPALQISQLNDLKENGFREKQITLTTHVGTHLDAPAHILEDGKFLDRLPLSQFYGRALALNVQAFKGKTIPPQIFDSIVDPESLDFILFHTNYAKLWGSEEYWKDFPTLSPEAAGRIIKMNLKGIGFDVATVDPMDSSEYLIHKKILSAGLIIIENLTNLDKILNQRFILSVFPLNIHEADGFPVRAVAMVENR